MGVATARTFVLRVGVAFLALAGLTAADASRAHAQGITSSGLRGKVTDTQGQAISGATVEMIGAETGQRYQGPTGSDGGFFLTNIPVGSYSVQVRAIGFRPVRRNGVVLSLGATGTQNFQLEASTVEVAAITTTVPLEANDVLSPARTGPGALVSDSMVRRLPSLNRSFADFIATVPQVVDNGSGPSISGQNNRYNNIQIDGSVNNDLFGLAGSGTPGGQANARPISVEAIREFQVLIAPYDVRQGGFTGGLVNAITRSGTNEWHGSLFGYWQGTSILGQNLVGRDSLGNSVTSFFQRQWGATVGGPIIHDKLFFFGNFEPQTKTAPFTGLSIGSDTSGGKDSVGIGIRAGTALRVSQIVKDSSTAWGGVAYDPGGIGAPVLSTPATNAFMKLTWQPAVNNTVEFSYNHVDGSNDIFAHNSTTAITSSQLNGYELGNAGYKQANTTNTYRAIWTRPFGSHFNNEMILADQHIFDHREVPAVFPLVLVGGDRGQPVAANASPATNVSFGSERASQGNSLDQKIIEISDNLTITLGTKHLLTVGTHNELFKFHNVFFSGSYGLWSFRDTTALLARNPFRYEIFEPVQPLSSPVCAVNPLLCAAGATGNGPIADFHVNQLGGYVQDRFQPNPRLNLTLGVRVDAPMMNSPAYNIGLDTARIVNGPRTGQAMGINTQSSFPTSNPLWSPRFGFNYDVKGNGQTMLRGGLGVFSGRPPYVWLSNAFVNTGLEQVDLLCDASLSAGGGLLDSVPAFTANVANMPNKCGGTSAQGSAAASVVYFNKNFHLPQDGRVSVGLDQRLPWNMTATFDAMYTKWLNAVYLTDVNVVPGGFSVGEGNRQLYGTFSGTSATATVRRETNAFRGVILQENSNKDYQYQFTIGLQKRFSNGLEFNGGYTYARAYDLMSLTSSISNSNLNFAVLDGTLDNRNLRPAAFDVPNRVTFSVTGNLPFKLRGSLEYFGRSGTPYAYVYANDVNGDGYSGQDPVYVPLNANDIQMCPLTGACTAGSQDPAAYAQLNAYIKAEPCLASQRGKIMQRTSCRNPWQSMVNGQLTKGISTFHGQSIELTAEVFNLLSMLGVGGKISTTSSFEETNLLSLSRYNAAAGRGVYTLATSLANLRRVDISASRWRMLLGARYNF
ncbi:MAG TPA: carboxypeptidase regulatory-like domain-containing protein [Gemmatimonadales bacterium]|jgi:hypothetical protein